MLCKYYQRITDNDEQTADIARKSVYCSDYLSSPPSKSIANSLMEKGGDETISARTVGADSPSAYVIINIQFERIELAG